MRIAITHPTAWPEVRRGSERLLNNLAYQMAARGHSVTIVTTAPEPAVQVQTKGSIREIRLPRRNPPAAISGRWFNHFHLFGRDLAAWLRTESFEAVHCLNYHDAAGALVARRSGSDFRLIFQCTGIPVRRYFRRIPLDGFLFRAAVMNSDSVVVLSRFAADALRRDYGVPGVLLPSPTDTLPFEAQPDRRAPDPYILFSGDADEPRKGAVLLARAFPTIAERLPGIRLLYTGRASAAIRSTVYAGLPSALHGNVCFLGLGKVEDLPRLYAEATVCVNPAVWEALGNVLVEALAAGTPVVGARHGGIPDIIANGAIGAMFEPGEAAHSATNVAGLADAVVRAAALAQEPGIRERCRMQAHHFGWRAMAPRYARLLGER